jgi:hypothetical protein
MDHSESPCVDFLKYNLCVDSSESLCVWILLNVSVFIPYE